MEVNDMVLSMSLWALAFCMWLLVYCYGYWQMVKSNHERKHKRAKLWLAFVLVWLLTPPVAVLIKNLVI